MRVNICNSKSGRTEQRQMSKWLSSCSGEGVVLKERVGACMIYEALLTCVLPLSLSLSLSLPFSLRPCGIIVGLLRRRRGLAVLQSTLARRPRPPAPAHAVSAICSWVGRRPSFLYFFLGSNALFSHETLPYVNMFLPTMCVTNNRN